jgi:hypothetical protein
MNVTHIAPVADAGAATPIASSSATAQAAADFLVTEVSRPGRGRGGVVASGIRRFLLTGGTRRRAPRRVWSGSQFVGIIGVPQCNGEHSTSSNGRHTQAPGRQPHTRGPALPPLL